MSTAPSHVIAIFQQAAEELRAMGPNGFRPNRWGSTSALPVINKLFTAAGIELRTPYYRGHLVIPQYFHKVFRDTILTVIAGFFPEKVKAFMCDEFLLGVFCVSDLANCCRDLASGACKFCDAVEQRTGFRNMLFATGQRFRADGKTRWQGFGVREDLGPDGYGAFAPMLCSFPVGAPKEEKPKDGRSPWKTSDAIEHGVPVCSHFQGRQGCQFSRDRTCVFPHVHPDGTATASTTGDASGIVALVPGASAGLWRLPRHAVAPADSAVEKLQQQLASLQAQLLQLQVAAAKQELAEAKHAAPAALAAPAAPAPTAASAAPAGGIPVSVLLARAHRERRAERRKQREAGKVGQEAGSSSEPSP